MAKTFSCSDIVVSSIKTHVTPLNERQQECSAEKSVFLFGS